MHSGIREIVAKWFNSFVCINGINSRSHVSCGVRKDPILGPQLFILYINDNGNVSDILNFIIFADDTDLLYRRYNLDSIAPVSAELHNWYAVNKLSLNVTKTN